MKRNSSVGGKNIPSTLAELAEASSARAALAPESRPQETSTFREGLSRMSNNMFLDLKQLEKLGPLTNAQDLQTKCYNRLVAASHDAWVEAKQYEAYASGNEDAPVGLFSADRLGERMIQLANNWDNLKEELNESTSHSN